MDNNAPRYEDMLTKQTQKDEPTAQEVKSRICGKLAKMGGEKR